MRGIHIKRISNPNSEFTRHVPGIHRRISNPNIEFTRRIPDTSVEFIKNLKLEKTYFKSKYSIYKTYSGHKCGIP